MTGIPEGLQTPPAAGAVDLPPPLQPGTDAHGYLEFNLDHLDGAPAPNFIAFGHDPVIPDPTAAVINAWALEDLSSDDDTFAPTETATQFIKGHAVHGARNSDWSHSAHHVRQGWHWHLDIARRSTGFICKYLTR